MFFIGTNAGGQALGTPDVCLTPAPPSPSPVPVPYPNTAMLMDADAGSCSQKVKVLNKNVVLMTSKINMSSGDEAGTSGGVMSGKNKGEATFKLGSSMVKIEGKKPVYQNAMTAHNGMSANLPAGGTHMAPSQTKVKVAP